MKKLLILSCVALLALCLSSIAAAVPISLDYQLTGDFRLENPDNLIVDVNIISDTTSAVATWTVDINSPAHPNIKLDEFYFNLALPSGADASIENFSPNNAGGKQWASVGGTNAAGSGSADFDFGVGLTGGGSPNPNQVNNAINLSFDVTLTGALWTEGIIIGAPLSTGGGIPSPGSQMGAHLQSLNLTGGATSDSGFASAGRVPEPTSMLLFGTGLAGLGVFRRKFKKL
jgi:hypothetical protein